MTDAGGGRAPARRRRPGRSVRPVLAKCEPSRPACAPQRRLGCVAGHQGGPDGGVGAASRLRGAASGSRRGASSRIRWALVPLMPNEDTPARRGARRAATAPPRSSSSHVARRPSRRAGWARRRAASAGSIAVLAAPCTILITPADARRPPGCGRCSTSASRASSGRSRRGPGRRWRAAPAASIGSPSAVPVPCASTASTSAGSSAGVGQRLRGSPAPGTGRSGAVRPLDAPSWLTARAADHGEDPVAVARGRRRAAPAPAGRRPRPSRCRRRRRRTACSGRPAARPRCRENSTNMPGRRHHRRRRRPAPASHSPARSAWHGQVQRDQRGRAGGVDRERRALAARACRRSGRTTTLVRGCRSAGSPRAARRRRSAAP